MIVLAGPTASGKSAVAIAIARIIPAEIVSADSMQVYKGMSIGTSKPTPAERAIVPHHLVDFLDINEPLDVYSYKEKAEAVIQEIRSRGRTPIVVGGTGLYIRALLHGLDQLPSDPGLKERLWLRYDAENCPAALEAALREKDPEAAALCASNPRRLLRALEVFELTGKSITEFRSAWKSESRPGVSAWRLVWERARLFERIIGRVDAMLAAGWVDEARRLISQGFLASPTARQAIGYKIIAEHIEGRIDATAMRVRIISATKKYARRQETWFANQHPEMKVLNMPMETDASARLIVDSIS